MPPSGLATRKGELAKGLEALAEADSNLDAWLAEHEPVARAGTSIRVYFIPGR